MKKPASCIMLISSPFASGKGMNTTHLRSIYKVLTYLHHSVFPPIYHKEHNKRKVIRLSRNFLILPCVEFKKQHLRVFVDNCGVVTITGERPLGCSRRSRFRKQIKIPMNCKKTEIRAMLCGGVLEIRLPKQTSAFPAKPCCTECNTTSASMPSCYLLDIQSSSSRLKVNTMLALQVAGVLAVMVAFGAYAYGHCGHAHGEG